MATYKVIQDIEAEDHILGPLSLRQFIFAILAVLCFYFCYLVAAKHLGFLIIIFLPPGLFFGFFAAPFGKDQPTEVWALAKIRYFLKPRHRIWDQAGVKELVSITVPKKVEIHRTDGLSQTEVQSRLSALASTIDSRGWVVKNVDVNLYTPPDFANNDPASDRLINTDNIPRDVPSYDVNAADDIMDARNNPIAQQFDQMINASTQAHRQQLMDVMQGSPATLPAPVENQTVTKPDYWFMRQPGPQAGNPSTQVVHPAAAQTAASSSAVPLTDDEIAQSNALKALKAKEVQQGNVYGHMKTIQPLGQQSSAAPAQPPAPQPNPKTQQLASNNDLNISTIARVAGKKDLPPDEEVVISLH